ncbi:serine repeat antigen 1 [Plasmodium reichenowi]|uniref:Serine repeat antigen 1 n=1 Tax=Plasmodium reichenowi TaxID=5854 RepID=A0A060RN27_PLARE|nr:serine repeat antigen 1 [Plasmodium reichenowi]
MKFFIPYVYIICVIFIINVIRTSGGEDDDNNNISGKSILGTRHNNISNIDLSSIPNLDSNIYVSLSSDTKEWSPNNLTSKKKKKKKEIRPKDIMSNSDSSNTSSINKQNNNQIKSVLLKENKGVKITGPCNVNLSIFLVPHIYIDVETKYNNIELKYELDEFSDSIKFKDTTTELSTSDDTLMNTNFNVGVSRDTLDKDRLYNICTENKTFKFVVYFKDNVLTLKWKVYETGVTNNKVDIRQYKMKELTRPITTIQIHSVSENKDTHLLESKNYVIKTDIPETCDAMATNCFLSGNINIEKCLECTLLVQNNDTSSECFTYVSNDVRENFNQIKAEAEDDENFRNYHLTDTINNILKRIYKININEGKKELITLEELDNFLKESITDYCKILREIDTNGTLVNHELGNNVDVFNNLIRLLKLHKNESISTLHNKLRNSAICMKYPDKWIEKKTGLILPNVANNNIIYNNKYEKLNVEKKRKIYDNKDDSKISDIINIKKYIFTNNTLKYFNNDKQFCNSSFCNRLKDENNCISKIQVEDQGNCAISWIFASKYYLETLKCMKGYEPHAISALYIANCSKRKHKNRCNVGSNPLEFLQIIEENQFLPMDTNYLYSYTKVGNDCPDEEKNWVNLLKHTRIINYNNKHRSTLSTKAYRAYESEQFKDKMDTFIKLIKDEIMNKGSVIAYVKAENVLGYELNGKKVQNLCGDKKPDHVVNIVGYGNYINDEDEKKSYWIVRNSWGKYWGDDGYFNVDMYGPSTCEDNFIHTVVVFNINMPKSKKSPVKITFPLYNYYLKYSPDFYHNLYYKNFNSKKSMKLVNASDERKNIYSQEDKVNHKKGSKVLNSEVTTSLSSQEISQRRDEDDDIDTLIGHRPDIKEQEKNIKDEFNKSSITHNSVSSSNITKSNKNTNKVKIYHIIKHVKNTKIKIGFVKYDNYNTIGTNHTCSRSYSEDQDKHEGCIQFCELHWNECKDKTSPGYCLTKLKGSNECFFCYV